MPVLGRSGRQCAYSLSLAVTCSVRKVNNDFPQSHRVDFPVALFLDAAVFSYCSMTLRSSLPTPATPAEWMDRIGNPDACRAVVNLYFSTFHVPLAFISKFRFHTVLIPAIAARPDVAMLVLCMQLVLSEPISAGVSPGRSEQYLVTRQYLFELEQLSMLTVTAIQARLLVGLYSLLNGSTVRGIMLRTLYKAQNCAKSSRFRLFCICGSHYSVIVAGGAALNCVRSQFCRRTREIWYSKIMV